MKTLREKLAYLQENHFTEWLSMRSKVSDELSSKQLTFCVCGRLATGLHENGCRRFNIKITNEAVRRLSHLAI